MNQLPVNPLSSEEQQRVMGQMYLLIGKQVERFHRHHHMGMHSSVRVELAQELMESVLYTVDLVGGVYADGDLEVLLRLGQERLENKRSHAKSMLTLVNNTAPRWQTTCRWDALGYLDAYLAHYDFRHLAHKGPEGLFYPILVSQPEGIRGIDECIFYLNIMWIENQIMTGVPEKILDQFWRHLPVAALNQCEYLLINGMGRALLKKGLDSLAIAPDEQVLILTTLKEETEEKLKSAAKLLCDWLDLKDESTRRYVEAVIPQIALWMRDGADWRNPVGLFIS